MARLDRRVGDDDRVSAASLSPDEIHVAVSKLSMADLVRLKRAGAYFAVGVGVEANDFLNEAICRALDGTRTCPKNVPVVVFLINVMRSMASSARVTAKESPVLESLTSTQQGGTSQIDVRDLARSAEENIVARGDSHDRLKALESLFADDEDALMVVMGDLDGLDAEDTRALGGWDLKAYATIRRRMRRRIDAKYPGGWVQ